MFRLTREVVGRRRGVSMLGGAVLLSAGAGAVAAAAVVPPVQAVRLLTLLVVAGFGGTLWLLRSGRSGNRAALRELHQVVDQTQRRVLAVVERDRMAGADRQRELLEAVERSARDLDRRLAAMHRLLGPPTGVPSQRPGHPGADAAAAGSAGAVAGSEVAGTGGDVAGPGRPFQGAGPAGGSAGMVVGPAGGAAGAAGPGVAVGRIAEQTGRAAAAESATDASAGPVDPGELMDLLLHVARERPSRVLQVSGGTSAVWVAGLLCLTGGRLVDLEPDDEEAVRTRNLLAAYGLTGIAEVRTAPRRRVVPDDQQYRCFDPDAVADQCDVDLLLVGADGVAGTDDRLPVAPELLAATATVVLVGVDRARGLAVGRRWAAAVPGLTPAAPGPQRHPVLRYERPTVDSDR